MSQHDSTKIINKVVYDGDTLIDLTSDTVTPENLLLGATAHNRSGEAITGTVDLDSKVSKSGDTMSANLNIQSSVADITASSITVQTERYFRIVDKNGIPLTTFGAAQLTNGNVLGAITSHRKDSNGNDKYNQLFLKVLKDGTKQIEVSDPGAWRDALELSDSGWLSITDNTKFTGTIYYRKLGKIVFIQATDIKFVTQLSSQSYHTWSTLIPSGYRPDKDAYGICWANVSSLVTKTLPIRVDTSGDVFIYSNKNDSIATTANIRISITYPIA